MSDKTETPDPVDPPAGQPFDDGAVLHHPNVIVALAHARADIGAVGKTRTVTEGARFAYRGIEDVVNAASQVMARHGVTVVPRIGGWQDEPIQKGSGSQWHRIAGEVHFDVYGPAGIADVISGSVVSHADDNADKGPGKLHSYALKTFLIELLMIPTEDLLQDNEAASGHPANQPQTVPDKAPPPPPSDPEKLARVVSKAQNLGDDSKAKLKQWLAEKHVSLQSVDTIGPKLLTAAENQIDLYATLESADRTGDVPETGHDHDEELVDTSTGQLDRDPEPAAPRPPAPPSVVGNPDADPAGLDQALVDQVDQMFLSVPKGAAMKAAKDALEAFDCWPISGIGNNGDLNIAAAELAKILEGGEG